MSIIINEKERLELDAILKEVKLLTPEVGESFPEVSNLINKGNRLISRSVRQFESASIIIIAAGMLKSGKSTLVNLLSRSSLASPVGFGIDTTKRAALIRLSPDKNDTIGTIDVYNRLKTAAEGERAAGEEEERWLAILDHLRDLDSKQTIHPHTVPLTAENLSKAVVSSPYEPGQDVLDGEPLLVVINVPENKEHPSKILQEGCMLLDMPGLDSGEADICKTGGSYLSAIGECDMLLFVQSSVAPLNEKAIAYLKEIRKSRSTATYRVIQNRMEAAHWETKSSVQKAQLRCSTYAEEKFREMDSDIKIDNVNLGMAYFSIFGRKENMAAQSLLIDDAPLSREKLYHASGYFSGVEQKLLKDMQENSSLSRYLHCQEQLVKTIRDVRDRLDKCCSELEQKEKDELIPEQRAAVQVLQTIQQTYTDKHFCTHGEVFYFDKAKLESCIKETFGEVEYEFRNDLDSWFITVKKLNEILQKVADSTYSRLVEWWKNADLTCVTYKKGDNPGNALTLANDFFNEVISGLEAKKVVCKSAANSGGCYDEKQAAIYREIIDKSIFANIPIEEAKLELLAEKLIKENIQTTYGERFLKMVRCKKKGEYAKWYNTYIEKMQKDYLDKAQDFVRENIVAQIDNIVIKQLRHAVKGCQEKAEQHKAKAEARVKETIELRKRLKTFCSDLERIEERAKALRARFR